jgi:hypothetical protein
MPTPFYFPRKPLPNKVEGTTPPQMRINPTARMRATTWSDKVRDWMSSLMSDDPSSDVMGMVNPLETPAAAAIGLYSKPELWKQSEKLIAAVEATQKALKNRDLMNPTVRSIVSKQAQFPSLPYERATQSAETLLDIVKDKIYRNPRASGHLEAVNLLEDPKVGAHIAQVEWNDPKLAAFNLNGRYLSNKNLPDVSVHEAAGVKPLKIEYGPYSWRDFFDSKKENSILNQVYTDHEWNHLGQIISNPKRFYGAAWGSRVDTPRAWQSGILEADPSINPWVQLKWQYRPKEQMAELAAFTRKMQRDTGRRVPKDYQSSLADRLRMMYKGDDPERWGELAVKDWNKRIDPAARAAFNDELIQYLRDRNFFNPSRGYGENEFLIQAGLK